nr:DNA-directed DNA polymerase [Tanacetum cinerariifolium]
MQTRSSSRLVSDQSSNPTSYTNQNPKGRNRRRSKKRFENLNLEEHSHPVVTMADQHIMAQLLQAPIEDYEDAIGFPAITADNFELKHGLLTLGQNKHPDLARERTTLIDSYWDDLVSKFINQFSPPSKTTSLRNEITNFQQRFDESFSEAWDRFKDLLRACPHYGFLELHQLDTFYNTLNSKDQDSLNFVVGGNFLDKMPRDCLSTIESKSKVRYSRDKPVVAKVSTNASTSDVSTDVAELKDMVKALLLEKSIQEFVSQASAVNYNQGNTSYRPQMMSNQIRPPGFPLVPNNQNVQRNNQNHFIPNHNRGVLKEDFLAYVKANDAVMKNMQTQGQNMQNQLTNLIDLITNFMNSNSTSTSCSGTLPSNTIANPKSDLKAITTRSGVSYDGPQIPPPVVENEPEATKDTMNPTNNENTEDVQLQPVQSESPFPISKPETALVSASKPKPKASIPYPSRRNDERNREKANNKLYQIFKDMSFEISFADALIRMPKFALTLKNLIGNKEKLSEMARTPLNKHFATVLLKKLPNALGDPGKFLITYDFLVGVAEDVYVKVGSFHFPAYFVVLDFDADPRVPLILRRSFLKTGRALIDVFEGELTLRVGREAITFNLDKLREGDMFLLKAFLNDDPSLRLPNQRNYLPEVRKELKICEAKTDKSSVDESLVVELKSVPPHLEYAFLECDDKLPVIIAKDLSVEEKTALITVLMSHKRAIAWKLFDIKGINPKFCTYKILMEEEFTPALKHQRRVNPKIYDVIKQEVFKLLDAGLIYPISDSPWVSPVHCVPKKGGFTVVENEDNELISTRLVTGWRVCIDYRKLNEATRKDHFPLPFMDHMLERLEGNQYYFFLTVFLVISKFLSIPRIRRKPHSPAHTECLLITAYLLRYAMLQAHFREKMLKRCEDTNLCLNWEKSHLIVKECIVLGHKISKQGIEVDREKVDFISKLPHPTTVKGIRSFLGHAGFFRRFIKDFSKIARPMTRFLEKDTPFIFSQECVDAFQTLKRKLTEAPILIAPDWDMPFELMCDASNFSIGAVLGQHQDKHFRPIHYAKKTMTEA